MELIQSESDRGTSADQVFDLLHDAIVKLTIPPGTRISEVEVAKQLGVSRQPVREAFIRLGNLNLLKIRPQRATVVRKFSEENINRARFVRLAVECEVVREACRAPVKAALKSMQSNVARQQQAIERGNTERFHDLDYDFHRLICAAAGREYLFQTIAENKSQVDRLCMLSLTEPATMEELLGDHTAMFDALNSGDEERMLAVTRHHLSRLDSTISTIRKSHADFFEG